MRNFFRLHVLTRRRHGLPPQPYRFFRNIHEELISKGFGFIVSASQKETNCPIAASVFLSYGDKAIYKFGASDESKWNVRPNNLIMWEGIKYLVRSGFKWLHFGRTDLSNEGLRKFKLSWGAQEKLLNYLQFSNGNKLWRIVESNADSSRVSKITGQIFSHLPLLLNRTAGALIYPHLD